MLKPLSLLLLSWCGAARADIYASMANVDSLLDMENHMIDLMLSFTRDYEQRNHEIMTGKGKVIENPIIAFRLIRRLTHDWATAEELMRSNFSESLWENTAVRRDGSPIDLPQEEDFDEAAVALMRLQDVYKLDVHDMADGRIRNLPQVRQLNAFDCYSIGRVAYHRKDYYHMLLWMQEAVERLKTETRPTADIAEVLEHLAYALFRQGNGQRALLVIRQLVALQPDHPRARRNIEHYERLANDAGSPGAGADLSEDQLPPLVNARPDDGAVRERDVYETLCRMDTRPTASATKQLFCYLKRDRPFLKLAPLKVEVLNLEPKIVFFRQMLSDLEIAILKEVALPMLERATVHNSVTGETAPAPYRVTKSAWLSREDNPVVRRVSRRIEDMTGFNMDTAELLQIANYGIGGFYLPHYDMSTETERYPIKNSPFGNRIGTVLFYMSQPLAGGGTVFPPLRMGIAPSKYDAAFWLNLKRSGRPNLNTLHAACPVLAGVKWVAINWIRERGQEFRRPCSLNEDE